MCSHQFADDTTLHYYECLSDTVPAPDRFTHGSAAVCQWFVQNYFQHNTEKSEITLLGTADVLHSASDFTTVNGNRTGS